VRAASDPDQLGLFSEPERLFVCTPSRLAAFDECPRRYRFTYVDRPQPPKGPPWAHNSLGASVHTAMRAWFDLPVGQRRPDVVRGLLRATWVRDGYRDVDQERECFERAEGWLHAYLDELEPAFEPVGVERTVAAKTRVLAFSGRVDRIDEVAGELVIVDYKTGRSRLDADDARGSRALALYAVAAERVFRRPCRRVELHHLPTGTVAAHEHSEESLARHLTRAERTAGDIVAAERALATAPSRREEVADEAFPVRPGSICGWCDFRRVCPAGSQRPGREQWAAVAAPAAAVPDDD
jgi:RecB family exonuclease